MIQYDMASRLALSFWRDAPKQAKSDDFEGFWQNRQLSEAAPPRWHIGSSQKFNFVGIHVSTQGQYTFFEYRAKIAGGKQVLKITIFGIF